VCLRAIFTNNYEKAVIFLVMVVMAIMVVMVVMVAESLRQKSIFTFKRVFTYTE
jgi:hypothetical protein